MQIELPHRVPGRELRTLAVDEKPRPAEAPLTKSQRARLAALLRPIGAKPGGED